MACFASNVQRIEKSVFLLSSVEVAPLALVLHTKTKVVRISGAPKISKQQPTIATAYILDYFEDVGAFIPIHFGLHETSVHLKYIPNSIQLTSYEEGNKRRSTLSQVSSNTQVCAN